MDFYFTQEQQMLRDSAARYLGDRFDFATRQQTLRDHMKLQRLWQSFADFGWLAALFPEAVGGLDGGGVEMLALMEGFGRHLIAEPFISTIVVGGSLVLEGLPEPRRSAVLAEIISGKLHLAVAALEENSGFDYNYLETEATQRNGAFYLSGKKPVVQNGALANKFIVSARTSASVVSTHGVTLFLVDRRAPGLSVHPYRLHDGFNGAAISLENVEAGPNGIIGELDLGYGLLEKAADRGIAALCAEAAGSADYLLDSTVAYLKLRSQYGQPLAKFQALQHRMADMHVAAELIRSMAYFSAMALKLPDAQRKRDISAAKVKMSECLTYVASQAVQLHGGMGVSEELDIGHHFKRAAMISLMFGDEMFHVSRFAAA